MKTSNAILLALAGIFAVIVWSGYRIIRYKFNNHLYAESPALHAFRFALPSRPIQVVRLLNIRQCRIVSSDALKIGRSGNPPVNYTERQDTVILDGAGAGNSAVCIYLPPAVAVRADYSHLELVGSPVNEELTNHIFSLHHSSLATATVGNRIHQFFGGLTLAASDSSVISFTDKDQINGLTIDLNHSSLDCRFTTIGRATVKADPFSSAVMNRYNESLELNQP